MVLLSRAPSLAVDWWRLYWPKLLLLILLANLPDFDFLFGLFGNPNELHRGFTHSFVAAVGFSLGLGLVWRIVPGFWRSVLLYFAAYGSHLLIDLVTGTRLGWTHSGSGIPLFWPWHQVVSAPLILIYGVLHKDLDALFSIDNVQSVTYELLTFGGITAASLILWKRKLTSRVLPRGPEVAATPCLAQFPPPK